MTPSTKRVLISLSVLVSLLLFGVFATKFLDFRTAFLQKLSTPATDFFHFSEDIPHTLTVSSRLHKPNIQATTPQWEQGYGQLEIGLRYNEQHIGHIHLPPEDAPQNSMFSQRVDYQSFADGYHIGVETKLSAGSISTLYLYAQARSTEQIQPLLIIALNGDSIYYKSNLYQQASWDALPFNEAMKQKNSTFFQSATCVTYDICYRDTTVN